MAETTTQSIPYDRAAERDPLIVRYIKRSPTSGEPIFAGPMPYPVAAIVQQLLVTGDDRDAVSRSFPELSEEALAAARRFWELHGDDLRPYLEKWE